MKADGYIKRTLVFAVVIDNKLFTVSKAKATHIKEITVVNGLNGFYLPTVTGVILV